MTVRSVLTELRRHGPTSRAGLVRLTGISAPTISKAVASLVDGGLLEEGPLDASGAVGRPSRSLRFATDSAQVLGVVLDHYRVEVGAARLDGTTIEGSVESFATPGNYDELLDLVTRALRPRIASERTTFGIGISAPGLTYTDSQEIALSSNVPITDRHRPSSDLAQRLSVPCHLIQEAHGLCLAERMFGGARDLSDYVALDTTTGLGAGVMEKDRILLGSRGLAGEVGHITIQPDGLRCGCGNRGCLETLATDRALALRIERWLGQPIDVSELAGVLARTPDRFASEIDAATTWLAIAIASVINVFNPDAVFVHSHWVRGMPDRFDAVVAQARQRALAPSANNCRIELSEVTKIQGAYADAVEQLFDAPL